MNASAQIEPGIRRQNLGMLITDLIIGACLGSILGVILGSLYSISTGLVGLACAAIGTAIGGGFYRVHDASLLSTSGNPHLETSPREIETEIETDFLSREDYVLRDAAASYVLNPEHSRAVQSFLHRVDKGTERVLTLEEVFQ